MTDFDLGLLRAWWLLNASLAGAGLGWNVRLWRRWHALAQAAAVRHENGAVAGALETRRRDAVYRVLLKAALASYALVRWEILTTSVPTVQDWRQGVDVALFSLILLILTAWSAHAWTAAQQRRRASDSVSSEAL